MGGVSIRPSDFVEGGVVPVDRNLIWEECRFELFEYKKKDGTVVATTTAARISYKDDEGRDYVQQYSASDPERFLPSDDGKTLVPQGDATTLNLSCNFYLLLNSLVSAGFPEDKLTDDISVLDGLYTHNIGVPEPKRAGLARVAAEGARERILSVPDQILKLPWEGKKGAKPAAKAKSAAAEGNGEDATAAAVAIAAALLEGSDSVTLQQVAAQAIRDKKQPAAQIVFKDEFQVALIEAGMVLEDKEITKA